MDDITALMNTYRECVRHLWNVYFRPDAEAQHDWDLRDEFGDIAVALFRTLVLRRLGHEGAEVLPEQWGGARQPFPFLHVEPETAASIMVQRAGATGYWDDPLTLIEKGDCDLRFLQFFDWDLIGARDYAYYQVRIAGSNRYPHVVGRDALIAVGSSIRVLAEPAAPR